MRRIFIVGLAAACSAPPNPGTPAARINFRAVARLALSPASGQPGDHGGIPDGTSAAYHAAIGDPDRIVPWRARGGLGPLAPGGPTPDLSASFLGLGDDGRSVPPDTMGAVGRDHLVVTLNTQIRVQTKDGDTLSTVTLDGFWSELGVDAFDPRIFYDHFEDRWITVAVGDARADTSAVLLGVSDDDDPEGDWALHKYDADETNQVWADYPVLGFNRRWIAVHQNMFDPDDEFVRGELWVFDKAHLYAGGDGVPIVIDSAETGTLVPAVTFDEDEEDLRCLAHWSSDFNGRGFVRLYRITGETADPRLEAIEFAAVDQPWAFAPEDQPDFAPQAGSEARIQTNDARMHSVVQRDGSVWGVHSVFLPADNPTRVAVRFWELGLDGAVRQTGLVDGEDDDRMYAFPSLAVNRNRDVLIAFSTFGAEIFPSAGYAFRSGPDPLGEIRDVRTLREGQAPYHKVRGGRNRWGDYSAAAVDPVDDHTLWTIQEFANDLSGGNARFGVWWGAVIPPGAPAVWDPVDPQEVREGELLELEVSASDADEDDLEYTAEVLPEGAEFDSNPAEPRLTWTPTFEQAGDHRVVLSVTDGGRVVPLTIEILVLDVNRPPALAAVGDRQVRELDRVSITLQGSDPDEDDLTYGVSPLLAGAVLDPETGRFTWLPGDGSQGVHDLTFSVSDGEFDAERPVRITVAGRNRPPVVQPLFDRSIDEGVFFSQEIDVSDPDGDDLTVLITPLPAGASLDEDGRFDWQPSFDQAGPHSLTVTVTDGSLTDSLDWTVTVRNVNRPPVFEPVAEQRLNEGEQMLFVAQAFDADGDEVQLSAPSIPPAARFDPETGQCMWNAGFAAAGEWMLVIAASDGFEQVMLRVPVVIANVNRPPILAEVVAPAAAEGEEMSLEISGDDPDGDDVTLSILGLPTGAVFDANRGVLTWTPSFDQGGRYFLTLVVSDGDLSDERILILDVDESNRAPVIVAPDLVNAREGEVLEVRIEVSDPDGDLILLLAEGLPDGAQLTAQGVLSWTPGFDAAGDHHLVIVATDGADEARAPLTLSVANVDRPPTLAAMPAVAGAEGELLEAPVLAHDPDGDRLDIALVDPPAGMDVSQDGSVVWTPGYDQSGVHEVVVRVTARGRSAQTPLVLTIREVDRPPTLEISGDPSTAVEGSLLELRLVGEDPDDDLVTYGGSALPTGASLDTATGLFAWTPAYDQAGEHPVELLALSRGAATSLRVTIIVQDVGRPPLLALEGPDRVKEGESLEVIAVVSDPDGDDVFLTAPVLPAGAVLVLDDGVHSGVVRWRPGFDQSGEHRITLVAEDALLQTRVEKIIRVDEVNRPPELGDDVEEAHTVKEGESVSIQVVASDPDSDDLTFRMSGLPSGARIHEDTGRIRWEPSFDDSGAYDVEVSASDRELTARGKFRLTVTDVNRAPTVTAPILQYVQAGTTLIFTVVASDPDGDELTVSVAPLPTGATFNAVTGAFRWKPTSSQKGRVAISLTVTDGDLTGRREITIFVSQADDGGCRVASPLSRPDSVRPAALRLLAGSISRR